MHIWICYLVYIYILYISMYVYVQRWLVASIGGCPSGGMCELSRIIGIEYWADFDFEARWRVRLKIRIDHFTFGQQQQFFHTRKKIVTLSIKTFYRKCARPEPRITRMQFSAEFGCFQNGVPWNLPPRFWAAAQCSILNTRSPRSIVYLFSRMLTAQ